MIEIFGIGFAIIGLLPSIAATLTYSIAAGPAGMVWSWFLACMFIFIVGLAMADLGSAMPTSGECSAAKRHIAFADKRVQAACIGGLISLLLPGREMHSLSWWGTATRLA